jgi:hypothetical protein
LNLQQEIQIQIQTLMPEVQALTARGLLNLRQEIENQMLSLMPEVQH